MTKVTTTDTERYVKSGAIPCIIIFRQLSIIPTMGLRIYKNLTFSGTRLIGYTIGERYIHIWSTNGTACPTSLKKTLKEEKKRLNPSTRKI